MEEERTVPGEELSSTAHRLRNPIFVISGYVELLLTRWDTMADAERRKAVEAIDRQGRELQRVVEELIGSWAAD